MLKGDRRKQEILETSETLFCRYGYEKTSVQDILDILKLSKGSFYHHYESKVQILETICIRHAGEMAEKCAEKISGDQITPEKRINMVLNCMTPFTGEGMNFLKMLLPVFSTPDGRSVRACFREALRTAFLPLMRETMETASDADVILCRETEMTALICLGIVNDLWCEICDLILDSGGNMTDSGLGDAMRRITPVRSAIESILNIEFGSIELLPLTELKVLWTQLGAIKCD